MDDNLIIKLLDKQETSIKNYIDISTARVEGRLDTVIDHQKEQNGELVRHGKKMAEYEKQMFELEKKDLSFEHYQTNCPANKLATKMTTRRFWVTAAAVTTVVYIALATIWHTIGFGEIITKLVALI